MGPMASTERKKRSKRKMTLTVIYKYFEITAKKVEQFKITATTSARTESYPHVHRKSINKRKNFSPRPHARSHAF